MYNGENEEALSRDVYDDYDVSLPGEEDTPEGFFSPFTFLCFAIILALFGLLTLFSASYDISLREGGKFYSIFLKESIALISALVLSVPLIFIPVRIYRKAYFLLYPVYVILAVLSYLEMDVVDPAFIAMLGNINIVLLLSDLLQSLDEKEEKRGFLIILFAFLITFVLLSETFVSGQGWYILSSLVILSSFSAKNVKKSYLIFFLIALFVFFVVMTLLSQTLLEKDSLLLFNAAKDTRATLASHAVREGELFGVGIGNGLYKLGLIDDIEGMYIYASLSEETGAAGTLVILFSLMIILIIGIRTSMRAYKKKDLFSSVFSLSLTVLFVFSFLLNMLSVTFSSPFGAGVPLLLFSYSPSLEALSVIILVLLYKFIYLIGRDKQ